MKRILCTFGLLALGYAMGPAQVTKQGAGYLLRAKYAKGQKISYEITSTTPLLKKPMVLTMKYSVKDIKNGLATLEVQMSGGPAGSQPPTTIIVDNRNRAQSGEGLGAALPENAVKPGTTWKANMPLAMGGQKNSTVDATYTFAGLKTINGKQVAVINYKLSGFAKGGGSMAMLASDGTLFSNETNLTITMGAQSATVKTVMKRK